MPKDEPYVADTGDRLQRRLARFFADVPTTKSTNGDASFWLGTSIGSVRSQNQDRVAVVSASYGDGSNRNFVLSILADGMGGLIKGDEAATLAVSVFLTRMLRNTRPPARNRIVEAAQEANLAVYNLLRGKGGTTLSAVYASGEGSIGLNVGDSRIYGIDPNQGPVQLSKDDTLAGYLGSAAKGENRNHLVQYVGMGENLEPHIVEIPRRYTTLILSTDGVHGVPANILNDVVLGSDSYQAMVRRLLSLNEILGGRDNATALVVDTHPAATADHLDQGLNLKFVSAQSQLEIWLPILNESPILPVREALGYAAETENPKKKPASRQKGRQSKKGRKQDDPALPLEQEALPEVDVKFSSRDQGKH
jgi:PPM family protein phosphatase